MSLPSRSPVLRSTDTVVGKYRHMCRRVATVMRLMRGSFGTKAALELALRTDADQRSAECWLAGKGMSAENFAALICSDIGDQVLDAMMGADAKTWPEWYAGFRRQVQISSLRRGLTEQQRALAALEQEAGR